MSKSKDGFFCCYSCGAELGSDDIGAHKKLVNRGAEKFLCLSCLAGFFGVDEVLIKKKVEEFKKAGCALFC
ncbi:MAG: hypothetical protein WCR95_07020 [Eubacteriales bacterium]